MSEYAKIHRLVKPSEIEKHRDFIYTMEIAKSDKLLTDDNVGNIYWNTKRDGDRVIGWYQIVDEGFGPKFKRYVTKTSKTYSYVGEIRVWLGPEDKIPDNYLICDGRSLDRVEYEFLFDIIGTTYGSEDPGTFNIPDLTDKYPQLSGLGDVGSYIEPGLPNVAGEWQFAWNYAWRPIRTANYDDGTNNCGYSFNNTSAVGNPDSGGDRAGSNNTVVRVNASRASSVYKDGYETVTPESLSVKYIICYK